MTQGPLHSLFQRVLDGDHVPAAPPHALEAVVLAEGLRGNEDDDGIELADTPERSAALLAAYLDGGLDDEAQRDVYTRLSRSSAALHDAASADALLDAVAASKSAAPAALVAAALARGRPVAVMAAEPRRRLWLWRWPGASLALAAASLAVMIIASDLFVPAPTTFVYGPAVLHSSDIVEPQALVAPPRPVVAEEKALPRPPSMVTAGAQAVVPNGKDCQPHTPNEEQKAEPTPESCKTPPVSAASNEAAPGSRPGPEPKLQSVKTLAPKVTW